MDATSFTSLGRPKRVSNPNPMLLTGNVRRSESLAFSDMLSFQSIQVPAKAYVRKGVLARALQEDEYRVHKSAYTQAVNRDRLIDLFRRIQTSISKGKSGTAVRNEASSQLSIDDSSTVEASVIEFLQQSSPAQVNLELQQQSAQTLKGRKTKMEETIPDVQHSSIKKRSRPPSNFVKKSPIPLPIPLGSNRHKVVETEVSSSEVPVESELFGKMKLSELKGLAKDQGIRGYSKLKKSELIELLRLKLHA